MRYSQLVEAHVRAILITKKVTDEGEVIPYYQTELKVMIVVILIMISDILPVMLIMTSGIATDNDSENSDNDTNNYWLKII